MDRLGERIRNSSISPREVPLCATTMDEDEDEVETNTYFPTFARRRSSPLRNPLDERRRPQSLKAVQRGSLAGRAKGAHTDGNVDLPEKADGEDDDMFELDDEDALYSSGLSYVGETMRRTSDQSSSSTSTRDLDMVWDDEDESEADGDGEEEPASLLSPPSVAGLARQASLSSQARSPPSPKQPKFVPSTLDMPPFSSTQPIAVLPFVRKVRRPSEHQQTTPSPQSYQWQASAGVVAASSSLVRHASSASMPPDASQRSYPHNRVKQPPPAGTLSSPNRTQTTGVRSSIGSLPAITIPPTGTARSPTSAPLAREWTKQLSTVGRKRSMTVPLVGRPWGVAPMASTRNMGDSPAT